MSAADHFLGREMVHVGRIDERNRIAQRLRNVQFVRGKNDALTVVMCQIGE